MKLRLLMAAVMLSILCTSCTTTRLQGNYDGGSKTIVVQASVDDVWNRVIDIFSTKGYPINVLSKESGLITTETMDFTSATTLEKKGKLKNPSAYFVSTPGYYVFTNFNPTEVSGQWNVRIKQQQDRTSVTVNVVNIRSHYFNVETGRQNLIARSTGNFEDYMLGEIQHTFDSAKPNTEKTTTPQVASSVRAKVEQSAPKGQETSHMDSLENAKEEFAIRVASYNREIEEEKNVIKQQQSNIDLRIKDIEKRERELVLKEQEINIRDEALSKRESSISQTSYVQPSIVNRTSSSQPSSSQPVAQVAAPKEFISRSSEVIAQDAPYRCIQFVATSGGKTYPRLSHIGSIITEQVPGKSIYRYKVCGNWSDSKVSSVKKELASLGFPGAF